MAMLSLLTDITGSSRLESEDPRWTQLFHSKQILSMRGDEDILSTFANRLIENNLSTGNLIMLLGQTSSRIRQILERRGQPTSQNMEQCCISMHLLGLLLNIMFSRLSTADVMMQLRLSGAWQTPIGREVSTSTAASEQKRAAPTGDAAMRQLIADTLEVFSVPEPPLWMHDVLFCSANLLLILFSTQLYNERVRDENSNIFLSYVYSISEADMRRASPGSPGNSLIAEGTVPARLIKSVLHHACALQASPPQGSVVQEILHAEESGQDKNGEINEGFFSHVLHKLFRGGAAASTGTGAGANSSSTKDSTTGSAARTHRQASPYPLLEKCVTIMLILLHNRKDCDRGNPFREAFSLLCDEASLDDGVDESQRRPLIGGQQQQQQQLSPEHMINVDFGALASFLAKTLPLESSAHLLYALLTIHPTFTDYLISSGQAQPVLCAVLKGLYNSSCAACVDHLYVVVIDVLIMVQHSALRQSLSSLEATAPWYSEHALNRVTLADLTMLCSLRCTLYALFKAKDTYLLSNCFAIMIDLAPFMRNVDSYVSERMIKVVLQLARRTGAEGSPHSPSVESSPLMHSSSDQSEMLSVAGNSHETLAVLLRVCSLALSPPRLSANVHLLYALLHEQEKLKEALPQSIDSYRRRARGSPKEEDGDSSNASMWSLELLTVAEVYLSKLRLNKDAFVSAAEAVSTLRQLIDAEMQFVHFDEEKHVLSYSYSEVGNSDDFFVPCVWAGLIRSSPGMGFALRKVVLFNPDEKNIFV